MTIQMQRPASPSLCPNVFDAGLPTVDYMTAATPEEAHEMIGRARRHAPNAFFRMPPDFTLAEWPHLPTAIDDAGRGTSPEEEWPNLPGIDRR
jgi:hypothetical protein